MATRDTPAADESSPSERATPRAKPRARNVATGALFLFYGYAYFVRPDALQALHWWRLLLWTPIILIPWFSLRPWRMWKSITVTLALWSLMLHFEGELPALSDVKQSETAVVVTLNCAGGSVEAAREAFEVGAALVLLQEVGSKNEFITEARSHGYTEVVWSVDDAIFARDPLTEPVSKQDYAAATWTFSEAKLRVVSLRLHPPMFRLDLWNPECWKAYAQDTDLRRTRFAEIAREARLGDAWIVGGDFNATNPRIVRDSFSKAEEAMRTRRRSWLGTGTNDYPLAPVDQLWSPSPCWLQGWVKKTKHSDHRMLIAETGPFK